MAEDKVQVLIQAIDEASGVLSKIRDSLSSTGEGAEQSGASFASGFGKMALSVAAGLGIVTTAEAAVRKLFETFKQGLDDVRAQESAEIRLATAMKNAGSASEAALESSRELATQIEALTGVQDDLILSGQALLVTIAHLRGEGLERATRAAVDFSTASGKPLQEVFEALARAAEGNVIAIRKWGLSFDETGSKVQRFDAVLSAMERSSVGAGEAVGRGLTGSLSRLADAFGNVIEAGTNLTLNLLGIQGGANAIADYVNSAAKDWEAITKHFFGGNTVADQIVNAGSAATAAVPAIDQLNSALEELGVKTIAENRARAEQLVEAWKELQAAAKEGSVKGEEFRGALRSLGNEAKSLVELGVGGEQLRQLAGHAEQAKKAVKEFHESGNFGPPTFFQWLQQMTGVTVPDFASEVRFTSDAIDVLRKQIEQTGDSTGALTAAVTELVEKLDELRKKGVKVPGLDDVVVTGERATTTWDGFGNDLKQIAASQVAALSGALINAALSGKRSFGEFFAEFAKQMAVAIAQAVILRAVLIGLGFETGGQVPTGAHGGQIPRGQVGGQLFGPNLGGDTVLALLKPGEVILRTPVVDEIERRLSSSDRDAGEAAPPRGFQVHNHFGGLVTRELVEEYTRKQNELAEHMGLEVIATRVVE